MRDERVVRIRGDRADVFSHGFLCPKGSTLKQLHDDPDRLRRPLVKRDGVHVEVEWPEAWAEVERRTLSISGRAISSLINSQGIGDLYRIYATTQRDKVDFNLAYIPREFDAPHPEEFDTEYMRQLFAFAYDRAARGYPWAKLPPGLDAGP